MIGWDLHNVGEKVALFGHRREASSIQAMYIKVKVEHYLLFMFSPPKIS
jgi:hypothetical protein